MRYRAFISYSHAADGRLAPALQSGLHRFARPWYKLRALVVFRDNSDLSAIPGLWSGIEQALKESEYFVLLASREAARSKWVRREVEFWLQNRSHETLILVLTDGEFALERAETGDFDWESDRTRCHRSWWELSRRSRSFSTSAGHGLERIFPSPTRGFETWSPRSPPSYTVDPRTSSSVRTSASTGERCASPGRRLQR